MKQPMKIVRGTTNTFGISVSIDNGNADRNGAPYTLETGQVLVFGLKRNDTDEERVLVKKITNTANGEYYLELTPEDTSDLECGEYYYDVGLQHGSRIFYNVIKASPFTILPNITQLGDGA